MTNPKDFFLLTKDQIQLISKRRLERKINEENRFFHKMLTVMSVSIQSSLSSDASQAYQELEMSLREPFSLEKTSGYDKKVQADNIEMILGNRVVRTKVNAQGEKIHE